MGIGTPIAQRRMLRMIFSIHVVWTNAGGEGAVPVPGVRT
jgi:hypothetical protein